MQSAYDAFQEGNRLLATQNPHAAVIALERARDLEPDKASVRETLARAYYGCCRFAQAGSKFVVTDKVLSHYHFSESNLTSVGGRKLVGEMFRLTKKYGPHHGMLAYVYYFLYVVFDLRGYFDAAASIAPWKRRIFDRVMRGLRRMFGESCINNYNWNFASKQERGLCWYK